MSSLRILTRTASLISGAADPLLLGEWTREKPLAGHVRTTIAAQVEAARAIGEGKVGLVVIIPPGVALPDDEVRTVVTTEMKKLLPYLAAGATILPEGGMRGAAMRAVLSTLQLVTRTRHPERVFPDVPEAASFLFQELRKTGCTRTAAEIESAIRAFRAKVVET